MVAKRQQRYMRGQGYTIGSIREMVPWWARIACKLALSRLPVSYGFWRKLNIFAHGSMHQTSYALSVFQQHFSNWRPLPGHEAGFVALELGPGDSVASAIIARAYGAAHTYLVDTAQFATADVSVYRQMERDLRERGLEPPRLDHVIDIHSLLEICPATYGTRGLQSLRDVPTNSVDLVWSHAVLEHIRRHQFSDFMCETRRILRAGGICSHQVDLKDHLGGALNNLRIPSSLWEREWMATSGFYTNRLRKSEMVAMFRSAGFDVDVLSTVRWAAIPTPRRRFAREFQHFDTEDLLCSGFSVVLRPA